MYESTKTAASWWILFNYYLQIAYICMHYMNMKDTYTPYNDVIYRLRGYVIADIEEAAYPEFEISMREEIFFHTLQDAETKVAELAGSMSEDRYCFFIHEMPMGIPCYSSQAQSIRSYTADGRLFAQSAVSSVKDTNGMLEVFHGRDSEECPLQIDSLAEVFHGDYVSLEVIRSLPCDRARASEILQRIQASGGLASHLDYTDDGYTSTPVDMESVDDFHSHPAIVWCFPAGTLKLDHKA